MCQYHRRAFSAMGITLSKTWGSAYAVDDPDDGVASNYVISREYIKGNGYTKSGATMSFKDVRYFTYRASM